MVWLPEHLEKERRLIENLEASKATSIEVAAKMIVAAETEVAINEASETLPKDLIGKFIDVKGQGVGKVLGFEVLASVRADAIREVLERQVAALSAMSERTSEQAQQIDGALGA